MAPKQESHRTVPRRSIASITGSGLSPSRSLRLTRKASRDLFDQQSMKLLKMSGDEFRDRYQQGTLKEFDESVVLRVAMIMPHV